MQTSSLLERLIKALRCLPGVRPKSAQRMAFHLLQRDRSGGISLAQSLTRAMSEIGHCRVVVLLQNKMSVISVIIRDASKMV